MTERKEFTGILRIEVEVVGDRNMNMHDSVVEILSAANDCGNIKKATLTMDVPKVLNVIGWV
jgi:hypothetical protein